MNVTAAVVAVLKADASITGMVTPRLIYGGELGGGNEDERRWAVKQMPRAAIVVSGSGGGSLGPGARSYAPWGVRRLDIFAYGRMPYEADQLYEAVYSVITQLRQTVAAGTVIKNASVSGGPIQTRDPDTDWPYTLGIYDVSATES